MSSVSPSVRALGAVLVAAVGGVVVYRTREATINWQMELLEKELEEKKLQIAARQKEQQVKNSSAI